jgi:hypothetical protein
MEAGIPEQRFRETVVEEHFATPHACYYKLGQLYGGTTQFESHPKYLFRGEDSYYPTSTPGTYRALKGRWPISIKYARLDATGLFVEEYKEAGGDPDIGEALAQHYLTTSDGLDFSASLGIALAFALGEREITPPHTAYIGVLDKSKADASTNFCLHDLRLIQTARRPVRQHGFVAVHHAGNFFDLKDSVSRDTLGLVWYSFDLLPADIRTNRHPRAPSLDALYDIRDDPWAAKMIDHLTGLVDDPSPQWEEDGLLHLQNALTTLRSRSSS